MIAFLRAWLPFDKRVVWHDDQIIAYLQIGISTDVTMHSGALRIKHALQFVANTFADGEPDNCAIRAVDKHVVDRPKKSSAAGHHFVTDHVGYARQIIEIAGRAVFHRRSTHCHCIRPDGMQSGSGNNPSGSASSDYRFAVHDDKTSHAFAVTLQDHLLDLAESLRGFHIDDSASE